MNFYWWVKTLFFVPLARLLVRFEVEGEENLPEGGGYIMASNHPKWCDPVLLPVWWPVQVAFVGKVELFRIPGLAWFLRKTDQISIDREKAKNDISVSLELASVAAERLSRGMVLALFPEGTRSKNGRMGPFKRGAALVASQTGSQVVPVRVSYASTWFGLRLVMRISIGKPIESAGRGSRALTEELEQAIAGLVI